jgi:serine/threonine protein kinase
VTPERWAQIRQIFDGALERPEVDRAPYLRVVCAGDDDLRKEVEGLLESYNESTNFLGRPAYLDPNVVNTTMLTTTMSPGTGTGEYSAGFRLGAYQLQKCIGRGGMGSVWLAARFDSDFTKNVAIKLVKPGMDSQEILRRFRLERQVLAGLNHPNIAALIDGGSTPDGLPYLVMEYVAGTRIDHYCEEHESSISERLKLFRSVCAAVQYAHSNLVVHRDIKMGNILVTADGVPKLLDFGIAKLLHSEFSTLAAAVTRPEFRPMTPDYASPEQVRGDPITTATDVYSLGVLLYRLLTGKFPYGLTDRSFSSIQTAILEKEPIRPSAVVLTDDSAVIPQATQKLEVGETETRLKARQRLKKKLSGDLDMIVLMALRKEPQRRYGSVEQFSEDIRRYLEGRPVIARSDTFGYRTAKFVRRNAPAVIATTLLGITLIGATVVSERAASRDRQARAALESRLSVVERATVRQQHDMMDAYFRLGQLQAADPAAALAAYRSALSAARAFAGEHPGMKPVYGLAVAAMAVGDLASGEALDRYREAARQLEADGDTRGEQYVLASRKLGAAEFRAGDRLAGVASLSKALQIAEDLLKEDLLKKETGGRARRNAAACNLAFGEALARNGEDQAATPKLRRALDLYLALADIKVNLSDTNTAAYERAVAQWAAAAPPDLRAEVQGILAEF